MIATLIRFVAVFALLTLLSATLTTMSFMTTHTIKAVIFHLYVFIFAYFIVSPTQLTNLSPLQIYNLKTVPKILHFRLGE